MKSRVFFADLQTTFSNNLPAKINNLLLRTDIKSIITKLDLVAVKMHFGEKGNTAFIRPIFIQEIVDQIQKYGGKAFLTDSNTLYRGERSEAVSHLNIALKHGFNFPAVNAPVVISDGLRGNDSVKVKVEKNHFSDVFISSAIFYADVLFSVAHFKGHEITGFGGALKNIGMGCASREGKLKQHSDISPKIKSKTCIACGKCQKCCPVNAIELIKDKFKIDPQKCIGCAECITICPKGAVMINWDTSSLVFQEKMIEYAFGVIKNKEMKCVYINFLTNISPACDCYSHSDRPIVPDIGILASIDPVAIDQASADLVNSELGHANSALMTNHDRGKDKFRGLYPEIDWEIQLKYAENLGIGRREYELLKI
jgi:hypothetical protein